MEKRPCYKSRGRFSIAVRYVLEFFSSDEKGALKKQYVYSSVLAAFYMTELIWVVVNAFCSGSNAIGSE